MDIYGVTLKIVVAGKRDRVEDVAVEGAHQANSNAQASPCSFLPGRAGAGAGLENLVQVADCGSSRQL